jgi:hypothetical protein
MQPKKKPRNGTLTPQEKEENRRISSVRVRIEHVIGDIKRYRIIHDIIRSVVPNFGIWLWKHVAGCITSEFD